MVLVHRGITNPELGGTECTSFTETAIQLCRVVVTVTAGNFTLFCLILLCSDFDEIHEFSGRLDTIKLIAGGAGFRGEKRDEGEGTSALLMIGFFFSTSPPNRLAVFANEGELLLSSSDELKVVD